MRITYFPQQSRISTQTAQIEALYSWRNRVEVQLFLAKYPRLILFLLDAHPIVLQYFGASATVFLEVVHDPEIDGMEQLFAYIRTPLPIDTALKYLNKLDEEWFIGRFEEVNGLFNFNLDLA
jgi:hypothetical protein